MKLSRNMAKTAAITIVLLMASVMLMATPDQPVKAELPLQPNGSQPLPSGVTPDVVVKTTAQLSFRPNPVGLNQIFLVNMWISPALHVSRYLKGYKVTIQKPNGDTDVITMDSYQGDATAWFEYIADQEGVWKLKFEFPGGYFPAGIYQHPITKVNYTFLGSCYYEPASTDWQELVVKKDYVALSWPPSPLPSDYWTRPVPFEHREWTAILGDFPWRGPGSGANWPANTNKYWDTRYNFIPYVQAPNSAHIVWKRLGAISGLVGAGQGYDALTTGSGGPSIIYQGKCYEIVTLPGGGGKTALRCYDLRTGEKYWEISPSPLPSGASLQGIEYVGLTTPAVPGAVYQAAASASLIAIGGGRLLKFHPWTGAASVNVSISPLTTGTYYRNGYALSVQTIGTKYYLINWTTLGTATTFKSRIMTNISWPFSRGPSPSMGFDFESGYVANTIPVTPAEVGAITSLRIVVAKIKTGEVVWNKTFDTPPFDAMQAYCADHGKITVVMMDGRLWAWDLATGDLAWKSDKMDYPWDATGFGTYGMASAYGLVYRFAYSGIYAFNWTNGKIVWKYEAPAAFPYETPYIGRNGTTVLPFDAGGWVADGKVYAINTEHTPTAPITRGWGVHCVNATTGELIWKVMIPAGGVGGGITGLPGGIAAIADGYMVVSSIDGYMYVLGKGKSSTTVSASPKTSAKGSQVLIEGTVLDMSPAQPGTPCVSKESMATWMEYLHRQMPMNGIYGNATITGVPVTLTACKDDGKVIDLGTVTTNGYYGTFSFAWTPPEEGTYTIIASFAGDDSYGSSAAATAITVGPAPPTPETPEIPTPIDYTPTLAALTVAVIIAIIIGVANLYALRKQRK